MISTGIAYLDSLTGGLHTGDNVVWQVADGVSIDGFIRAFFANNDFSRPIIYINANYSPQTITKRYSFLFERSAILIDAFTNGKGNGDPVFLDFYSGHDIDPDRHICLRDPRDISSFIGVLNGVERQCGNGAFYIFDSLTGLHELWKSEGDVIDFFAFKCPKLYDMNTLAYWVYERDAHSREFIASITHITQVIFSISAWRGDYFNLSVMKLENRPWHHGAESHRFRVVDREVSFEAMGIDELARVGEKVKQLRKEQQITQAELAQALGMTAGAVSQIENNVISPSLQTLVQMASFFKKPVGYFIDAHDDDAGQRGYVLSRGSARLPRAQGAARLDELMLQRRDRIAAHRIILPPNTIFPGPLLLHRGAEFIVVTSGSACACIGNEEITLNRGDSLMLKAPSSPNGRPSKMNASLSMFCYSSVKFFLGRSKPEKYL
jgi:transcriptional regulator with XRE-family HTH domain